jgi:hypothetical protein
MATRDHTSRVRPSVPADDTFTGSPNALSPAGVAWPKTFRQSTRADIALAVLTLTRLHHDSDRWRKARAGGFPARSLVWPLSEAEITSLDTAVHCLLQYARLLGDAPRVSYPPGH